MLLEAKTLIRSMCDVPCLSHYFIARCYYAPSMQTIIMKMTIYRDTHPTYTSKTQKKKLTLNSYHLSKHEVKMHKIYSEEVVSWLSIYELITF